MSDDDKGQSGAHCSPFLVQVGQVLLVEHVVQLGNLASGVSNDGELEVDVVDLVDAEGGIKKGQMTDQTLCNEA